MGSHYRGRKEEIRALDAFIKLTRCAHALLGGLAPGLEAEGLTPSRFGVLETLYHLGPLCQKDLGSKLLVSGGNITLVVDNLEGDGLVRRERGEDRRFIRVHLTPKGKRAIARIFPAQARRITDFFRVLSPREQEELGRLCRTLGRQGRAENPNEKEDES